MYTRELDAPKQSFFLFGPRATGKSTWLKQQFPKGYRIDLLPSDQTLQYIKNPSFLRNEVLALSKNQWIIIDEVQKVPQLLDEVHFLMENHGYKKFALSGSSARKIKRGAANLLAGRAILKHMYPLTAKETNFSVPVQQVLHYGLLPLSVTASDDLSKEEYLKSYVKTYLNEEIKNEGLVRNIGSFARFLEIASLAAGQKTNISNLARDSEISRDTIRGYFSIFEDTLIGSWLSAYRPRAKIKEVASPKFYWFDPGVLHAAAGGFEQPLFSEWKGVLLEHWIYHEIKSYMHYAHKRGSLGYWSTPSGSEIDFLWWYGKEYVAIEVKSSDKFRKEFSNGISSFSQTKKLRSSWVIYLGTKELKIENTHVLPVYSFLKKLHSGEIF